MPSPPISVAVYVRVLARERPFAASRETGRAEDVLRMCLGSPDDGVPTVGALKNRDSDGAVFLPAPPPSLATAVPAPTSPLLSMSLSSNTEESLDRFSERLKLSTYASGFNEKRTELLLLILSVFWTMLILRVAAIGFGEDSEATLS